MKIYDLELTLEQKVVLVASPREQVPERKQTVRGSVWIAQSSKHVNLRVLRARSGEILGYFIVFQFSLWV